MGKFSSPAQSCLNLASLTFNMQVTDIMCFSNNNGNDNGSNNSAGNDNTILSNDPVTVNL